MDRAEAFNIVRMIARGDDPYSEGPHSRNLPENNPETIKALCIALAQLLDDANPEMKPVLDEIEGDQPPPDLDVFKARPLGDYLNNLERDAILRALEHTNFNKTQAAELLGLTFRQLRYKLDVHNLPRTRSSAKSPSF